MEELIQGEAAARGELRVYATARPGKVADQEIRAQPPFAASHVHSRDAVEDSPSVMVDSVGFSVAPIIHVVGTPKI